MDTTKSSMSRSHIGSWGVTRSLDSCTRLNSKRGQCATQKCRGIFVAAPCPHPSKHHTHVQLLKAVGRGPSTQGCNEATLLPQGCSDK